MLDALSPSRWTDLAIADEHASFDVTCGRWNIGLADGGTQRLSRIVGFRRAMERIVAGRVIDAEEAHRVALVNEVVPRPGDRRGPAPVSTNATIPIAPPRAATSRQAWIASPRVRSAAAG